MKYLHNICVFNQDVKILPLTDILQACKTEETGENYTKSLKFCIFLFFLPKLQLHAWFWKAAT